MIAMADAQVTFHDPLYERRAACSRLITALRQLPAVSFTVEELGWLLLSAPHYFTVEDCARIEALWERHRTDAFHKVAQ
jgi:hypothetical protein